MKKKEQSRFFGEIKLAEHESNSLVQIMTVGTYRWFGDPLQITPEMLATMKKNFDDNVKKVDLAVDYFHASGHEAAGWIKDVVIKDGGKTMWLDIDWTERAREKILAKEIKYTSIDFDLNYIPNDSDKEFGPTLNGAAVTNRPFIKGMNPLFSESLSNAFDELDIPIEKRDAIKRILDDKPKQGTKIMDLTDLKKECAVLSESGKSEIRAIIGPDESVVKMAEDNTSLKKATEDKDAEIKTLSEKVEAHDKEIEGIKKEAEFVILCDTGKAVEAQKASFLAGEMSEFIKLAQPVNLDAAGKSKAPNADGGDDAPKTYEEAQVKFSELAKEKMKDDDKLDYGDAVSLLMSDPANAELVKLYEEGDKAAA